MTRMTRAIAAALLLLTLPAAQAPPQDLDSWVQRAMKTFDVPGVSLAIVKDGAVVVTRGYGVRKLGDAAPVDAKTLFGIASNTKAFTATALGILVDEGKIQWDAPVIDYVPWFQLSDPYVTREMTVRDLLVHRSGLGLGAGDLLWWPKSGYERKEVIRRLRYLPLATSFRSAYAYDNVLYLVAGQVIEEVSGKSWEDFIQTRVLSRVGMTASNVRHSDATRGGNVAAPHARVDNQVRPIAPFDSDVTNPAGGINSNAEDMAKWMIVQLAEGRLPDGTALLKPATARQLTTIVTPVPVGAYPPEVSELRPIFNGYALGFQVRDYQGRKLVTHTGGLPGYVSRVALIPELGLGVAVLTNQESTAAFESIVNYVLDAYSGTRRKDWIAAFSTIETRARKMAASAVSASATARDAASKPSLPLDRYAGRYRDAWYGDLIVERKGGGLAIAFEKTPALGGTLEHWQHDTFVARWADREQRADAFVTFTLTPDGTIDTVRLRAVSSETDFSFDFQDLLFRPLAAAVR
jgi:CubicO group peptidase (beta-lactamase class C family)